MNRYTMFLPCCILVLGSYFLSAQESFKPMANIEAFKSDLVTMSASTQTIISDFIQEKNLSVLSEKIISKGQLYFKKPNNIRWEYTEPYRYLIIISHNQLYTRDDKNNHLYDTQSNVLFQEMNRFITGCIQGDILENDQDYLTEYFESKTRYYVKLIPRAEKMKQMLNEVQIYFNKGDLTVSSLKMVESGEDYTLIDFINKMVNTDIPLEKFSFN